MNSITAMGSITTRGTADPATIAEIDRLAWHIEAGGLRGLDDAIGRVVELARRTPSASAVLTGVLGDRGEPEVARIRAFGLLALQLAAADDRASGRRAA